MQVIGLTMVGGCYQRGRYSPGWNLVKFDNGTQLTLSECPGTNGILDEVDRRGQNTKQYRERLKVWVKTGKMPPI